MAYDPKPPAAMQQQQQQSDLFSYYLTVNMNNICRVCLEKGNKLMPIFDPIKPPHFSILIMACTTVQVAEGDGLPPYICQKCISKLNVAFQFKTQCESADTKLRQCFENLNQNINPQPDVHYIEIKKDDDFPMQIIPAADEEEEEVELETLQNVDLGPTEKLDFEPAKGKEEKKKSSKSHQCETCGKVFRTKPGLVHHIRIHTGERPYICHLCDKRFINGGHLHTHMRTHTGEKNHVCSACSKAFATAQQLTKHTIAIHTSERPYGCTYCSKRFASSSNLNTHVKIHTGEKNYHCSQCGKSFSTKGQLYQHMLVHTGEKAFMCEHCNRRFSQKAHLVRHLKMHKN